MPESGHQRVARPRQRMLPGDVALRCPVVPPANGPSAMARRLHKIDTPRAGGPSSCELSATADALLHGEADGCRVRHSATPITQEAAQPAPSDTLASMPSQSHGRRPRGRRPNRPPLADHLDHARPPTCPEVCILVAGSPKVLDEFTALTASLRAGLPAFGGCHWTVSSFPGRCDCRTGKYTVYDSSRISASGMKRRPPLRP